ncbi:hypothetical protein IKG16_01865, partial [Candidatus Saccharibacteria bacterium]|nr:hypothetical protein [Candidatus Saccharibacteria bacterium]
VNTVNLTDCTEITAEVSSTSYRGATCSYTGNLPVGTYNVTLTSSWHSATYVLPNSFTIYKTIQDITYMQEMTTDICNRMTESTASNDNRAILKDSRDQKQYKISKLADGNCWMVQNLALDGGRTLTPTDSNVVADTTLPSNIENGTPTTNTAAQIYSGVASNLDEYGSQYGNLYNYMAATALLGTAESSGTITSSVCPTNWQLPNMTGAKSYVNLIVASGISNGQNMSNVPEYVLAIQSPPYYFPLVGYYYDRYTPNGYVSGDDHPTDNAATVTEYWINKVNESNSSMAYGFRFVSKDYYTGDLNMFAPTQPYYFKANGFSVRCVFGS